MFFKKKPEQDWRETLSRNLDTQISEECSRIEIIFEMGMVSNIPSPDTVKNYLLSQERKDDMIGIRLAYLKDKLGV